ncbi:MAG: hypothetical protein AAF597_09725, partial [Bacteroidota bacterium]
PFFALAFNVDYLHRTRTLSGGLYTWLNYGPGVIVGGGGNRYGRDNFLGQVEFMASPTTTYTWVGTPTDRFSVKLPIGLTIGTYFDFGNLLPAPPQLPSGFSRPNLGISAASSGFMHGTEARFGYDKDGKPKEFSVGVASVSATATVGYNILITNRLNCQGRSSFGLNRWYLQGQAYATAHVSGSLFGIGFGPWGLRALATLQTPNPTFANGTVTLNLPLDYTYNFGFQFGQSCNFQTLPPTELETELNIPYDVLIVGVTPAGGTDFGIFEPVTVNLATGLREEFIVPQGNNQRRFRLNYDNNDIRVMFGAQRVGGSPQATDDLVRIQPPSSGWRAEETLVLEAKVHLEEFTGGRWQDFREGGQRYEHYVEVEFGTGPIPDLGIIAGTNVPAAAENVKTDVSFTVDCSYQRYAALLRENNLGYVTRGDITVELRKVGDGATVPVSVTAETIGSSSTDANGITTRRGGFRITPQMRLLDTTGYQLTITYRARRLHQGDSKPFLLNGNRYTEELVLDFTTGSTVKMIGPEAVTRAYPESMMYNTYRDQRSKVCFAEIGDTEQKLGGGWIDPNTQELVMYYVDNVTRDTIDKAPATLNQTLLTWPELPSTLGLDKTYELQLRIAPKGTIANGSGSINLAVPGRAMDPRPAAPYGNGHLVYQNWFRTSLYATFADKVSNLGWAETQRIDRSGTLTPTYGT